MLRRIKSNILSKNYGIFNVDRDDIYYAFRCRNMYRKLSMERLDKKIRLCGICFCVCPHGKCDEEEKEEMMHANKMV
jgi:epoxyqueuosine reductase QueG